MTRKKDEFTKKWIIENSIAELKNYTPGSITIRGLHYRLVSRGMTNTIRHYKRVVDNITFARWEGLIPFEMFSDHDRSMIGKTDYELTEVNDEIETAKDSIETWMNSYYKNRWENQKHYIEVFIEKKALIGQFDRPCSRARVTLGACKGYPSLTFLNQAKARFDIAEEAGKKSLILYFGDYDPSGLDIPRSIDENLKKLGCNNIEMKLIALNESQVIEWNLPAAPAKDTDSRTKNFKGLGQVELDAVEPKQLQKLCSDAISKYFDNDLYEALREQETEERSVYVKALKKHVQTL